MQKKQSLIFEMSRAGREAYSLPNCDVPEVLIEETLDNKYLRKSDASLPEVSELDVVRHFTQLSQKNHGVDSGFYPLGCCPMKYNPQMIVREQKLLCLIQLMVLILLQQRLRDMI